MRIHKNMVPIVLMLALRQASYCSGLCLWSVIVLMLVRADTNNNKPKIAHKSNSVSKTLINPSNSDEISCFWYQTVQNHVPLHLILKYQNDLGGLIASYA